MRIRLSYITLFILFSAVSTALQAQQTDDSARVSERQLIDGQAAYIEGLSEFENENYEKALDLLSAAYVKLPENAGVNFALADAYLKVGDLTNAAYYGKQAARLEPSNKWYRLKLAEIYRSAGKNEATIDELEAALQYHPAATDVLTELARTYADHGEYLKSNEIYNRLLYLAGESITIHLEKLKNFSELNMRDSVIAELQQIRKLDPDNLSTMQVLSSYYLEMDRTVEAKKILNEALAKNERDPKTLIMLADIYADEAHWDSVGTLLGTVITDPVVKPEEKLTVTRYLVSQYQQRTGNDRLKEATSRLIQQFIETESDFAEAHALAADFYIRSGQTSKALDALRKTTEMMPTNESAWRQLLQLLVSEGLYKEAIEAGPKADEQVPQDPFVLYFWGSAHLAEGHYAQAADILSRATRLPARRPLKSGILSALGDAYAGSEQWEQTFNSYEESLKLDGENAFVLNNYAYYLSLQKRNLDKAEQMALKAIELDPENASFLDTAGWVYFQKEEYEKARRYIQASIDTGAASAEVLEHMGDVMNKLDKPEEAKKWWQRALEKDSSRTHLKEKISI